MSKGLQWDEDFQDPITVAIGAASVASTALAPGRYVMYSDVDCYVKRVTGATAATSGSFWLKSGVYWFFTVGPDEIATREKVAVIQKSTSGTLYIAKVNR